MPGAHRRDRRTLLDGFVQLFLDIGKQLKQPMALIVDAYYACRKVLRARMVAGQHYPLTDRPRKLFLGISHQSHQMLLILL